MKRLFRILLFCVTASVLLLAVGLGVVLATFDPNDYKEHIRAAAERSLGRPLRIEGSLETSFFPSFNFKTGPVVVIDSGPFENEPLLSAQGAYFSFAVEALLSRTLLLEDVLLRDCVLHLKTDNLGRHNWRQFTHFSSQGDTGIPDLGVTPLLENSEGVSSAVQRFNSKPPAFALTLAVNALAVENLRVSYLNEQIDQFLNIHIDQLDILQPEVNTVLPIAMKGIINDTAHGVEAKFCLEASAKIDHSGSLFLNLKSLDLQAERSGAAPVVIHSSGNLTYNLESGDATWKNLRGTVNDIAYSTDGNYTSLSDDRRPRFHGSARIEQINLDEALRYILPKLRAPQTKSPKGTPNMPEPLVYTSAGAIVSPFTAADKLPAVEWTVENIHSQQVYGTDRDIDFALRVDRLILQSHLWSKVTAEVTHIHGNTRIPFSAELYRGTVQGQVSVTVNDDTPSVTMNMRAENVRMDELNMAMSDRFGISGLLRFEIDVAGKGMQPKEVLHSLQGTAKAWIASGEVQQFSLIPADLPGITNVPSSFPFESITVSAQIKDGLARSKNIRLSSPVLSAQGGGTAHLPYGQLDLGLDFLLGGKPPAVPVSIHGPYNSLSAGVDMRTFKRNVSEKASKSPREGRNTPRNSGGGVLRY